MKLRGFKRTYIRRVRLIQQHGEFAEDGTRLHHPGDLNAFFSTETLPSLRISSRPVVESALSTVSPAWIETAGNIEQAIANFARMPNGGLLLTPDTTLILNRDQIIALAARHRLPAVYPLRVFVEAGGLMSYATDQVEILRQAASYVDRLLRGAKPADLPVQAPTKYETVLNLKTAKALGLDAPPSLLVRADEVIE
jgi:ABC-type uncharacterized transport system substrate-binding protein